MFSGCVVYSIILTDPRPGLWCSKIITAHMHKWPGPFLSARMLSMQKDWLSFDEQLELLAGRGMCIEDECTAVQVLSCVSYYRLSGYFR